MTAHYALTATFACAFDTIEYLGEYHHQSPVQDDKDDTVYIMYIRALGPSTVSDEYE